MRHTFAPRSPHILALLSLGAGPPLRASLSERYGCQVTVDVSPRACQAVAGRLEASLSPAQMAGLAKYVGLGFISVEVPR